MLSLVEAPELPADQVNAVDIQKASSVTCADPFKLSESFNDLETTLKRTINLPKLKAGVFLYETGSGKYIDIDSQRPYSAASTIKVPVLVKLLSCVDKRQVSLDKVLIMSPELIGGGSGDLQWRPVNSKISVRDAAELMITHSDNTATNMIINVCGGKDACNKDFANWGLKNTSIANWLPDLEGTNKTSPHDLAFILGKVDQGSVLSDNSRAIMYDYMSRTRTKTLLPRGLGPGAKIVHKTGDIGSMIADCGIVTTPDGHKYFVAMQVERPHNDRRGNELIRTTSRLIYEQITGTSVSEEGCLGESTLTENVGRRRVSRQNIAAGKQAFVPVSHQKHQRRHRRHSH